MNTINMGQQSDRPFCFILFSYMNLQVKVFFQLNQILECMTQYGL